MKNNLINRVKVISAFVILGTFLLTGCSTTNSSLYHYNDYAEKYYALKKEGDPASLLEWQKTMESIVVTSKNNGKQVPPGIYANLGYIKLRTNDLGSAVALFKSEKEAYPQATVFMDRLIQKAEKRTQEGAQ